MRQLVVFWGTKGWMVGVAILLAAISPPIVAEAEIQSQKQASKASLRAQTADLDQREQERQALIERSQAREGCITLILNGEGVLIRAGMLGRDGVTGNPLQAGICVKDRLGTTAITDATGHLTDVLPGLPDKTETEITKPIKPSIEPALHDYY